MGVNEVVVNGETVMSTRNDTVSENNLLQGETATNRAGEHVEGQLDPAMKDEAYLVSDDVGEISEDDYIPFNDVSDEEQPKKKTVFSSIISKIKGLFVEKKPSGAQHEFTQGSLDLTMKAKNIDASMSDNNVSALTYPTTGNFVDNQGRIMMREEATINPDGKIGWKAYVRNYDTQGNNVGQKGMQFRMDKTGGLEYIVDDPNAFRSAINTVDQLGVAIPDNTDLDTYKTAGTYRITSDASAGTMSNLPLALCGKLVVLDNGNGGYEQFYFSNHSPRLFRRTFWDNAWSNWTESSSSTGGDIGNYFGTGTVSGSAITSTISGFTLKTGVIVSLKLNSSVDGDCTININNTGAKYVRRNDYAITSGIRLYNGTYTFIYDGIYYRLISTESIGSIYSFPQSYVADTSGLIVLDFGFNLNKAQIKYSLSQDKLAWNRYKNSAWKGDVKIADFDDLITQKGISIPSNADLNTYRTNGVYYIVTQAIADTVSNIPIALSGKLIVMGITSDGGWNYQFYIPNHQIKVYVRREGDGSTNTWTDWKQFLTEQTEGVLHLYRETTTADDLPININFSIKDTTTGQTYSRDVIKVYQDHQSTPYTPYGFNTLINSGGNLIVCSGEASEKLYNILTDTQKKGENIYIISDSNTYLENAANDFANRKGFLIDNNGNLVPIVAETPTNNQGQLGTNDYKLTCVNTYALRTNLMLANFATRMSNNVDLTQSDNGVSSNTDFYSVRYVDKNDYAFTKLSGTVFTNGSVQSDWIVQNFNTSGISVGVKGISLYMDKSGNLDYRVGDAQNLITRLGFGLAEDTRSSSSATVTANLTTVGASYRFVAGATITVKFNYNVPANATLNIGNQGAHDIYYRDDKIKDNVLLAGDRGTFINNGSVYRLLSIDRDANYQDVIYKVYNGTNSMKNTGVQDLEEITLSAGVYLVTWREQVQSTSLVGLAFGFSSTKKTSGVNFSAETGYYGCFSRTGVLEDHCCSLPVRVTASTKFYAQHFVGGSTALTSALGRLEITRIK